MKFDARLLVRLYPRKWRERYEEELLVLTGDRLDWSPAMDLANSALIEHLKPRRGGARPIIRALGAALLGLGVFLFILIVGQTVATGPSAGFARATRESSFLVLKLALPIATVWLTFALLTILLAIIVDGLGWRHRWPAASTRFLQVAVFAGLLVLEVATAPPIARISPFSLQQIAALDLMALVIGMVVVRSLFGKTPPRIVSQAQ